jgi:hypothetical protein
MHDPLILACLFGVAVLYSSVGHGGASGYLAVLALFAVDPKTAATGALVLTILVAGLAWIGFSMAGHFSWRMLWPFLVGSVPFAFLGSKLAVSTAVLNGLLAFVLAVAAVVMVVPRREEEVPDRPPPLLPAAAYGALIGVLSGIVGVGGGIFLSPLMIARKWSGLRRVAATSAGFIVVNSIAGLAGRMQAVSVSILPMVGAAFAGGLLGTWLGSKKLSPRGLRVMLAVVLAVAAGKLVMKLGR